jgi:hypothetical protein
MYKYRITKYNPIYRDPEGKYTIEDWTAISDIGKVFNNSKTNDRKLQRNRR